MESEQYRAEQEWLRAYIDYSTAIEIAETARDDMRTCDCGLADVYDVLRNGAVVWADRDHNGCNFCALGRDCDDAEIAILGRFESATLLVAINHLTKIRTAK